MSKVISGLNIPDDFYSLIEIPENHAPVKYEMNKEYDALFVDRFLSTAMSYPANYGYIPETLSEDGDPLDVLVLAPYPVVAGSVIRSRPVGVMYMEDEHGMDEPYRVCRRVNILRDYPDDKTKLYPRN